MWAGCALVFIPITGEYLVPHFLSGGKFHVLGTLIMSEFLGEGRNWPYAAAAAVWLLLVVTFPIIIWSLSKEPATVIVEKKP